MLSPRPWGVILLLLTIATLSHYCCGARSNAPKQPCKTCKSFVEAFQKNFKATANSNFAGGDTRWEEEKLGSYANSEVRLVEIMEEVCDSSDHDCHSLVAKYEEDIERWWFKLRHKGETDLLKWLCFKYLDVCCTPGHYGPNCEPCPGGAEQPCSGHGDCKGEEEKSGLGTCSCSSGYYGDKCDSCADGYYSEGTLCLACNPACKTCGGGSSSQCGECAGGYVLDDAGVCVDKDECALDPQLCKEGTYCFNTPGSHSCNACDRSCQGGCSGPGTSKCQACAQGFTRSQDGFCEDNDECVLGEASCVAGTHCKNTPGSYKCAACHVTCLFTCTGPGPNGCVECKKGYMKENDTCVDINECDDSGVCDVDTEVCQNLEGSHTCSCKEGFVRQKGKCAPKKRKSKKKKEQAKSEQAETGGSTGDQDSSDGESPAAAAVEGGEPSLLGDQLSSPDTSHDLPLPSSASQSCDPSSAECTSQQPPTTGGDGTAAAHPSSTHGEL